MERLELEGHLGQRDFVGLELEVEGLQVFVQPEDL